MVRDAMHAMNINKNKKNVFLSEKKSIHLKDSFYDAIFILIIQKYFISQILILYSISGKKKDENVHYFFLMLG